MDNIKIGIVIADADEYKTLEETIIKENYNEYSFLGRKGHKFYISNGDKKAEVISILCGIGKVNATAATTHLVDIGCNYILNYGLSGGISNIHRNDLCLCDRFLEHDFDLTGIGYAPCEKPSQKYVYEADEKLLKIGLDVINNVKIGTAVTGDRFICDSQTREFFKNSFNAMCCDMETAAIAYVCDFSGIPFLSLRRISDDAGENAMDSYREMNSSDETLLSDYILKIAKVIVGL